MKDVRRQPSPVPLSTCPPIPDKADMNDYRKRLWHCAVTVLITYKTICSHSPEMLPLQKQCLSSLQPLQLLLLSDACHSLCSCMDISFSVCFQCLLPLCQKNWVVLVKSETICSTAHFPASVHWGQGHVWPIKKWVELITREVRHVCLSRAEVLDLVLHKPGLISSGPMNVDSFQSLDRSCIVWCSVGAYKARSLLDWEYVPGTHTYANSDSLGNTHLPQITHFSAWRKPTWSGCFLTTVSATRVLPIIPAQTSPCKKDFPTYPCSMLQRLWLLNLPFPGKQSHLQTTSSTQAFLKLLLFPCLYQVRFVNASEWRCLLRSFMAAGHKNGDQPYHWKVAVVWFHSKCGQDKHFSLVFLFFISFIYYFFLFLEGGDLLLGWFSVAGFTF